MLGPGPSFKADRTKRALLLLLGSFDLILPFAALVGLELEAYRIGDESPMFARDARGVRSPSVSAPSTEDAGLPLVPFAPFAPCAGDDWKKRGEDAAGCVERGPRRGVPLLRCVRREAGEDIVVSDWIVILEEGASTKEDGKWDI